MMSLCSALRIEIKSTTFNLLYIYYVLFGIKKNISFRMTTYVDIWITLNQDYVVFWYCDISQNIICFLDDIIWYVDGTSEQVYFWILLGLTGWAKAMYVNDIWCWGGDTRSQEGFQIIWYKHYTCCDVPYDTMWLYIRIAWSDDMALG